MAQESLNFQFLDTHDPVLRRLASQAEHYFSDDPNTCLIKLRQLAELMAQRLAADSAAYNPNDNQHRRLQRLQDLGMLTPRAADLFHSIRRAGNEANHEYTGSHGDALHHLKLARELAVWFHRTQGNPGFKPGPFEPPRPPARASDMDSALADELARLRAERDQALSAAELARVQADEQARLHLSAQELARQAEEDRQFWESYATETEARMAQQAQALAAAQSAALAAPPAAHKARMERAAQADQQIDLDEAATRRLIDQALRARGWQADSDHLTYKAGARPHPSRNQAIAEWPTDNRGRADYALFCGLTCVGIIEAKRKNKDVPAVLQQAKRYSRDFATHGSAELPAPAGEYRVPFVYATNGRPFLQQLATKSGIWFWDARRPTEPSRPLVDWHTPQGLRDLLAQDTHAAQDKLAAEPFHYLGLRDYQIQAIRAVEDALAQGRRQCLLAMATGTGKTRTALGLIYRLVKSGRARRVLFVVDRRALGEQAATAFETVKLEQLESFADIYDMKGLGDLEPEAETRLHVATIQSLIRRVLGAAAEAPPIEQYDCIIVDECHRGYNLDRELSDTELDFRDEADYISKYRRVLDYFDAIEIGLTATPALHTTEIFGDPVYTYSYREAVIDGHLIDHEPPHRVLTRLAKDGIGWRAGERVATYNPATQDITHIHLPDEVAIDIDGFNRKVITEGFNRAVCAELATHIDPALPGKTLVFCVNRDHADQVVNLLKQEMGALYGDIDDDAVARITGDIDRPDQMIRRFKNEQQPRIAVTVDLLTTGVDVPQIVNLVFLRRVRSRILYAQMLGRATRPCPDIGKTYFRIFDCVSMYDAMAPLANMKPVVHDPAISFAQLVRELGQVRDPEARKLVRDQLVAKLQRKTRRIEGNGARLQAFLDRAGDPPDQVLHALRHSDPDQALAYLNARPSLPALIELLDTTTRGDARPVYISDHEDEVIAVERGYGTGQKPEDYLDSFGAYLREHMNQIPALIVVTQRPRELTRQHLRELNLALDRAGFSELALRTAHRQLSNQDIAASIIGYIRQQALGEPLLSYSERVQRAMKKILAGHAFTDPQRTWLERLAKQLETEVVADRDLLDSGQFRLQGGGFARLDKIFKGRLAQILGDINQALWEQTG